jgi:hypothetical protein
MVSKDVLAQRIDHAAVMDERGTHSAQSKSETIPYQFETSFLETLRNAQLLTGGGRSNSSVA